MNRRFVILLLLTVLSVGLLAAAGGEHGDSHEGDEGHVNVTLWKTVNFIILVVGLGYLVKRFAFPYFGKRTHEIQQGIVDAKNLREESEARAAEMEKRLANLDDEIAALRSSAKNEMAAEESRLRAAAEKSAERMEANARQEITSATKHARRELRTFASELALDLAAQKAKERMTPEVSDRLIDAFGAGLRRLPRRAK